MRIVKIPDDHEQESSVKRKFSFSLFNRGRSNDHRTRKTSNEENIIDHQFKNNNHVPINARHIIDFSGPNPLYSEEKTTNTDFLSNNKRDRRSYSISRSADIHRNFSDAVNKSRWSCFLEEFQNLINPNERSFKNYPDKTPKSRPTNLCCDNNKLDLRNANSLPRDNSITPTTNRFNNSYNDSSNDLTPTKPDSMISSFIGLQKNSNIPQVFKANNITPLCDKTLNQNCAYNKTYMTPNINAQLNSSTRPKSANFDMIDIKYDPRHSLLVDPGYYNKMLLPDEEEIRDGGKVLPPSLLPNHNSRRRNLRAYANTTSPGIPEVNFKTRTHDGGHSMTRPLSEHLTGINFDVCERSKDSAAIQMKEINNNNISIISPIGPAIESNGAYRRSNSNQMTQSFFQPNERIHSRCYSEIPDTYGRPYRANDFSTSDWLSKMLPYKLNTAPITYSNDNFDSINSGYEGTKMPTRRIPRQSLAQRNIMTQSMIAYIPDENCSQPNPPATTRYSRTISTDRYSSYLGDRPCLPSLAHLMGQNKPSLDHGEKTIASHVHEKKGREPPSPDFLRDQKRFLNDVESRADSPRLDQYYRLFHVRNAGNSTSGSLSSVHHHHQQIVPTSQLIENSSSSCYNQAPSDDFECMTLKRKDSSLMTVTKRPSKPKFIHI